VPRGLKSGAIDSLALKRLREQGLLLIIGAPASGATRTAYQVARADSDRRLVLAPGPPHGLKAALDELDVVSRLAPPVRLLLWLDRVDEFPGPGLTAAMLRRCRQRSPGLRVVATISSTRYAAWASENPEVAAEFGEPVTLERLPTPDELQLAQAFYPGVDFSEGIAAAFTAAAALLIRLRAGNSACPFEPGGGECTLARPVVEVALDWGRTGTPRPLPMGRLADLVGQRRGRPQPLDPPHLTHAVQWAATPLVQGAALLRLEGDDQSEQLIIPHTEIVEIRRSETTEPPAEPVWVAALEDAGGAGDSEAVGCIGFRAHIEGHPDIAARAWVRVTTLDELAAQWLERAAAFSQQRHEPSAERPPRERLLALTELAYGPQSVETAAALTGLGNVWRELGQPDRARALHQRALDIREREFGPDHPLVAGTLDNLGIAWSELGQPDRARALHQRALHILHAHFPNGHPNIDRVIRNLRATAPDVIVLADGRVIDRPQSNDDETNP
jgi:tetratricopeptide (TPR) repeat protein